MKKVDFNANTEWLYQQNWRLFQRALVELDIRDYVRLSPATLSDPVQIAVLSSTMPTTSKSPCSRCPP